MKTNFPRIKKFIQKSTFRRRLFFVVLLPLVFVISAAITIFEAISLAMRYIVDECRAGIYWVKRGW